MTDRPKISRIEAVINTASGSALPTAADEMRAILAQRGLSANIHVASGPEIADRLQAAVDAAPDLLLVLAGDGTARAAAELVGPDGPLLAPLAGGTMNMLPHAVYGSIPWQTALEQTLDQGVEKCIGGGRIDGRNFLVAAIVGAPALWAPAREAVREGKLRLALLRMRRAWGRAFSGRLRCVIDGGPRGKAEALAFLCPLASKALDDGEQRLEAAVIDPRNLADAARLGFNALVTDWRDDPAVHATPCREARVWAASRIPAVLDGEPVWLPAKASIEWRPKIARLLVAPQEHGV
jgi:diacylglycerol kinase family enzyme